MRNYIVTYKTPKNEIVERRVEARNHVVAGNKVADELSCEIVDVRRDDDGDEDLGRRVGGPVKTSLIALALGLVLAVLGVAAFWVKRGCPKIW